MLSKNKKIQLKLSAEIGIEVQCSLKHFRTSSFVIINVVPITFLLCWHRLNMNHDKVKKIQRNCRRENTEALTTLSKSILGQQFSSGIIYSKF